MGTHGDHVIDIEMQSSSAPLLASPPDSYGRGVRERLSSLILVFHSSFLFMAGANESGDPPEETSPSLSSISSSTATTADSVRDGADGRARMSSCCEIVVEDQSAPLLVTPEISPSSRKAWRKLMHILRSIAIIKARGNVSEAQRTPSLSRAFSSTTAAYTPLSASRTSIHAPDMARMSSCCEIVVEDQSAPLLVTPEISPSSRKAWRKLMHILRSIAIIKAGGNVSEAQRPPSLSRAFSSTTAAYTPLSASRTSIHAPDMDREGVDFEQTSSEYPRRVGGMIPVNQLQRCQSKNISKFVKEKNLAELHQFGGIEGVAYGLNTNLAEGITGDPRHIDRHEQKVKPAHTICHFVIDAFNSITILLLSVAAVLSLGFGFKEEGLENGWFDGAILIVTILVLVIFTSGRNYLHERRARKKLEKPKFPEQKENDVHVIRGGAHKRINCSDLVNGDVVFLTKGSQVPADGLFIAGQALKLDDGSNSGRIDEHNPFLFMGARVINGNARMVVTAVDMNTAWSEMMSKVTDSPDRKSNIEAHFNKLTSSIHITGLLITILIIIVLFLRYIFGKKDDENGFRAEPKTEPTAMTSFMYAFKRIGESRSMARTLTKLLSVSLVGITEGTPFVVSVAIMCWNHLIFSAKAIVQDPLVCFNIASVTVILTDKIGELTEHEMEVDKFVIGREVIRGCSTVSPDVLEDLCNGIGTLLLKHEIPYNLTEAAILSWAEEKLGLEREIMGKTWTVSEQKGTNSLGIPQPCGVLMGRTGESGEQMYSHWKGPVKEILEMCTHYYDRKGLKCPMSPLERSRFLQLSKGKKNEILTMIAFACKCTRTRTLEDEDLILVGLLELRNSKQDDTRKAIAECMGRDAKIILVSGDDVSKLKTIARQCGVLDDLDDKKILTGEDFRNLPDEDRAERLQDVCVVGSALPNDKLEMVKCLKQKGHVVAVIAQRASDAPALKEADVGITMGTWSYKRATENADILIFDGSFSYLITIIDSGRCFNRNIQKFSQLILIMTIASALINFFGTISLGDAPLTAIQLIWVNLVVVFLGGLALLTGQPMDEPVHSLPVSRTESLITTDMARNITIQVLYQVFFLFTLQYKGSKIIGVNQKTIKSMIFHSFIFCQFFNIFNARESRKKNFFKGIRRNKWFWVALIVSIALDEIFVVIQYTLGLSTSLNWKLLIGCVGIGAFSWVIDWVGKWLGGLMMNFSMIRP